MHLIGRLSKTPLPMARVLRCLALTRGLALAVESRGGPPYDRAMRDDVELDSDLLVVGGGLAGSALAVVMGRAGATVVAERQRAFRDRIRGEVLHPWGVVEAYALDLAKP